MSLKCSVSLCPLTLQSGSSVCTFNTGKKHEIPHVARLSFFADLAPSTHLLLPSPVMHPVVVRYGVCHHTTATDDRIGRGKTGTYYPTPPPLALYEIIIV